MPGPLWKHQVRNLDNQLDNCRNEIDRLTIGQGEVGPNGTIRKEIYNNANTVVEVAIKTRRPSGGNDKKKKHPTVATKARKVVHHRKSPITHSSSEMEETSKWSKLLSDSNNHTSLSEQKSKLESKRFLQGTKSSRNKVKTMDESSDEVDAVHGRFQNRTLQVFLHEMRAAVETEGKGSSEKIRKILDDLEYVAANLKQEKVEEETTKTGTKKKESTLRRMLQLSTIEEKRSSTQSLRTSDISK